MSAFLQSLGPVVHVYTDGACSGNPGDGGWGVYMMDPSNNNTLELSGADSSTTNNRMELMAAIKALMFLPENVEVHLYTDSQYVKDGISSWIKSWKKNGWKTASRQPVKNKEYWEELDAFPHKIQWHWVRGHNGDFGNERADVLARNAIVSLRMSKLSY